MSVFRYADMYSSTDKSMDVAIFAHTTLLSKGGIEVLVGDCIQAGAKRRLGILGCN